LLPAALDAVMAVAATKIINSDMAQLAICADDSNGDCPQKYRYNGL